MDPNADTVRSMSELLKKADDDLEDPDGDLVPQITITGAELMEGYNMHHNGQSRLHHQDSLTKRFHVTPHVHGHHDANIDALSDSMGSSTGLSISGVSDLDAYERSKIKKKQRCFNPKELKLKIFVIVLFILIVVGLVLTFHFYNQDQNIRQVGKRIYFDEGTRELSVTNVAKDTVLTGYLGLGLGTHHLPFELSDDDSRSSELLLQWKDRANMTIHYYEVNNTNCYQIKWKSLTESVIPWDCYDFGSAYWYGGGLHAGLKWPLQSTSFQRTPYVLGSTLQSKPFGPVSEPYWVTSRGAAIFVEDGFPLHVSFNATSPDSDQPDGQLCLYADYKDSLYSNTKNELPGLNYTICVDENIRKVHQFAITKIARPPSHRPDDNMFKSPIWSTWAYFKNNLNQQTILDYAEKINSKNYGHSILTIDDGWQSTNGDLQFDANKFPNVSHFIGRLKDMKYNVSMGINPFVNSDADAFQVAIVDGDYPVQDASGVVPGMVWWWGGTETDKRDNGLAAVLDMHQPSRDWFQSRLQSLLDDHHIDSLKAGGGENSFLPYRAHFHDDDIASPNQYAQRYAGLVSEVGWSTQIETAFRSQHFPTVPCLYDADSSWDGDNSLLDVIPRFLTVGLMGYPYPIPDPAGGSAYSRTPEKALFLRWLGLQSFFPIMHLSTPPYVYDPETEQLAINLILKHQTDLLDTILKLANESLKTLVPVVRPLWWIAPTDDTALTMDTEFMLGDDMLVAPILDNSGERRIYLPEGTWRDMVKGGPVIVGPVTIDYQASLGEVPHFRLQ